MLPILEQAKRCFTDCETVPEEQFEFYAFMPLFNFEELYWSDEESEGSEYEEGHKEVVELPPPSAFEKAFAKHSGGTSSLTRASAIQLAHALGFAPSKEDEDVLLKYNDSITTANVTEWLQNIKHPEDSVSRLSQMFQRFDKAGEGRLTKRQVTVILTHQGGRNKLTLEETEKLLKQLNQDNDIIAYQELCERVLKKET